MLLGKRNNRPGQPHPAGTDATGKNIKLHFFLVVDLLQCLVHLTVRSWLYCCMMLVLFDILPPKILLCVSRTRWASQRSLTVSGVSGTVTRSRLVSMCPMDGRCRAMESMGRPGISRATSEYKEWFRIKETARDATWQNIFLLNPPLAYANKLSLRYHMIISAHMHIIYWVLSILWTGLFPSITRVFLES